MSQDPLPREVVTTESRPSLNPLGVAALAAVATLVRAAYAVYVTDGGGQELADAAHYHEAAARLAAGLALPPTARWMPAYPLVLSAFYFVFGASWLVGRLVNALLGGLACGLLVGWSAHAFDRRASWWAGALYAVFPTSIAYSGRLLSENLQVPLVLGVSLALARCIGMPSAPAAVGLGLLFGLTVLTHVDGFLLFILGLGWLAYAWRGRRGWVEWGRLGLVIVACLAVMSPWILRNRAIHGRFIPLTTSGGETLLDGNREGAFGGPLGTRSLPPADLAALQMAAEPERDAMARTWALEWMRSHPAKLLPLAAAKLRKLWTPTTATPFLRGPRSLVQWGSPILFWTAILIAGWVGAVHGNGRPERAGLWLVFVQLHVVTLVFFALDRYRLCLASLWIAPAAWTFSGGLARRDPVRDGHTRTSWVRPLLLVAVFAFLAPEWAAVFIPLGLRRFL